MNGFNGIFFCIVQLSDFLHFLKFFLQTWSRSTAWASVQIVHGRAIGATMTSQASCRQTCASTTSRSALTSTRRWRSGAATWLPTAATRCASTTAVTSDVTLTPWRHDVSRMCITSRRSARLVEIVICAWIDTRSILNAVSRVCKRSEWNSSYWSHDKSLD